MMSIMVLLFCITSVIVILWYYLKWKQNYWRKLNIKYFQPVPIFGNVAKNMLHLNSFQETYQELYNAMGNDPYAGYYEMNIPTLMVKDPQLIYDIMTTDFKHFPNRARPIIFTRNKKLNELSMHLGSERNERWKFLRQAMSPFFSSGKIKHMFEKLSGSTEKMDFCLGQQMNNQNSVDVELKDTFEKLTTYLIMSCVFGMEHTSIISRDQFQSMMNETIKPSLLRTWHIFLASICPIWLNDTMNRAEIPDKVLDYFQSLILDAVKYRRLHGIERNDILQQLMNLQNSHLDSKFAVNDEKKLFEPHKKFDEIDIAANSFVFFFGSFETLSTAMSYCMYELALNENIQQNLRLEIQNVKDECGITYDSLNKMSYLDAVIVEALRKYPPTVTATRECTEDYVIPGTDIRLSRGINITIPTWSIHHDWRHYPNPEKFDPQRFLGNNRCSVKNGTYLPFGDGPRFCVAKRFAEVIMKAVIANMILKYDIKPCAKTDIPIKFKKGSKLLWSENGIWVNITRRKN